MIWIVLASKSEQFGRTKVMFIVARMLQTFAKIENMHAPGLIEMHHTIVNKGGAGVQVWFHRAPHMKIKGAGLGSELDLGAERSEGVS